MSQAKTQLKPVRPACALFLAELSNSITRQSVELESCLNPLRIRQVFQFRLKKKVSAFCFFVCDVVIGVDFAVFLDDVIGRTHEPISWLKGLLESRLQ